jgi:hypothetical protein
MQSHFAQLRSDPVGFLHQGEFVERFLSESAVTPTPRWTQKPTGRQVPGTRFRGAVVEALAFRMTAAKPFCLCPA